MTKTFWAKLMATCVIASPVSAQSISVGGHTVVVKEGPEFGLCARVLEAIEQVGEDAIGQCRPSERGLTQLNLTDATHFYLRWALIRDALPSGLAVPDWEERYLSDPEWYAEAAFLQSLLSLRNGGMWLAPIFSDAEIRQMVDQYLRDGTLPYDDGRDHGWEILPNQKMRYYQAEFAFRDYQQTISRFSLQSPNDVCEPEQEYQAPAPIFFIEPNTPEVGIVVNETGLTANQTRTDILTYDDELYHMRSSNRFLVFERNLPYPKTDPATGLGYVDACKIEILPNGY